ncbi:hypothetical protein [Morganella morganii]|uniref:hypothetical protein n=1 Tax=Morganella morganii TaxID=582 RepID=UPI003EBF6B9D
MKNPKLIVKPFAKNGQKNVIPENYETSMESNQATWDQGFGQITMLPVAAGGLPPKGQDFNGIFNQISENIVYLSQGGRFKFSAEYAEAIGGYPKGAILQSDDEKKEYLSLIDNNKVDFNTASDISASWKLVNTDDLLAQIASKQPVGDYATKTEVGLKLDKTAVVQATGSSTTSVISQDGQTKLFALKQSTDAFKSGNHTIVSGNDYAYVELINSDGERLSLETLPQNAEFSGNLILRNANGDVVSVNKIPKSSNGVLAIRSDLVGYQPVGDYATKTELNAVDNKAVQSFRYSSVRVTNTAVDTWSPAAEGEFLIGIRTALDGGGIWIVTAVKVATLQMRVGGQWVSVKNA